MDLTGTGPSAALVCHGSSPTNESTAGIKDPFTFTGLMD